MNIIEKRVKDLKPYEKNPRLNDDAVKYVAESIKNFGFKVPLVIDKDNNIVCGHTRWKACKKLKIDTVPCVVADDLTEEQIHAYRLADNKVGEKAEWDLALLDTELAEIETIDMTLLGFDEPITGDDFGTDFELPDGDKSEFCQVTFHVHENQKEFILGVCDSVKGQIKETFGNPNENGNALYEVCKQWAELKKSK